MPTVLFEQHKLSYCNGIFFKTSHKRIFLVGTSSTAMVAFIEAKMRMLSLCFLSNQISFQGLRTTTNH